MNIHTDAGSIRIIDVLPTEWYEVNVEFKLGFSAFYMQTKQSETLPNNPAVFQHEENLFIYFKGVLEYSERPKVNSFPGQTESVSVAFVKSNDALIFLCLKRSEVDENNELLENEVNANAVFASLKIGTNAILEKIITSTTEISIDENKTVSTTGSVNVRLLDFELSGINLEYQNIQRVHPPIDAIKDHPKQKRIILSTNWFLKSFGFSPTDGFLATWIALETLCMDSSSNIAPIKQTLINAYAFENDEVNSIFNIGRVYNLRNEIAHNGHLIEFEIAFLTFVSYIYEDCLNQILGLDCKRKAMRLLENSKFNLSEYVRSIEL
ncbi:HEPN domain-containing protein [Saprospiraceae bacterium]|nr:HEPN domain-containing protein [Saprospiraceae bacterium]